MNSDDFPDNSSAIFGRDADLEFLLERSKQPGLTAIVGRPMMGKTWLLTELARRLSPNARSSASAMLRLSGSLEFQPCRVGFFESSGEAADLLLYVVADLYTRWLSDASYWEQAQAVYAQQKRDFIGRTGEAFGTIVKELSSIAGKPAGAVGSLIKGTFRGLASVNRDLTSPMGELAKLQIEQARQLLDLVHKITRQPLVLILDQWEKSSGLRTEGNILDSFLRHLSEWPPCHVFVGARPDPEVLKTLERLKSFPETCVHPLDLMNLKNLASRSDLVNFLHEKVASSLAVPDGDLLDLIDGYPGTLYRWTHRDVISTLCTREDFILEAKNAELNRFPEFGDLLSNLEDQSRLLSIRLALLPQTSDPDAWGALSQIVLKGLLPKHLDGLIRSRVLESASPPSYGHAKRTEAALRWFQNGCPYEIRATCEALIYRLASQVRELSSREIPYASCLFELASQCTGMHLSNLAQALCLSLQLFDQLSLAIPTVFIGSAEECKGFAPSTVALLALGLHDWLVAAYKLDEACEQRDSLLGELRILYSAFPDDAKVREYFARGLRCVIFGHPSESGDELLHELRHLHAAFPDDPAVGEALAISIYDRHLVFSKRRETHQRRDALLIELHQLHGIFSGETEIRKHLAKGLRNGLCFGQQTFQYCNTLLEGLRHLSVAFPQDAALRKQLAMGLLNTLVDAEREETPQRRDALLEELRQLHEAFPEDASVREELANGLFNSLRADQKNTLERRDTLLEELRHLHAAFPGDSAVREAVAMGLLETRNAAQLDGRLERRDTLLEELRQLSAVFPQDAALRKQLAMGLLNTLVDAEREEVPQRRDALLVELRQLHAAFPKDATVREWLAKGFVKTLTVAGPDGTHKRSNALRELLQLHAAFPEDATVREWLAKGLVNILSIAGQDRTLERRGTLLDELRHLSAAFPQDVALRKQLAMGLFNSLRAAEHEDTRERRDALLRELFQLQAAFPEDAPVREWLAKGLFNILGVAGQDRTLERSSALRELRQLHAAFPEDATVRECWLRAWLTSSVSQGRTGHSSGPMP